MLFNKKLIVLLFSALVLTATAQSIYIKKSEVVESRNGHNYYIHQVEKGQTAYSIAKAYDVTVDEIYFENPSAKAGLSVGQELLIPTINKETQLTSEVRTANFEFFYHIAAANETFEHIASIYVIPVKYIRKANPTLHGNLREGEYVKVPVEGSFNALDGKSVATQTKTTPTTYTDKVPTPKPQVKPTPKPVVMQNTEQKKPQPSVVNTKKTPSTNHTNPTPTKTSSEFVSFDPDIPVIADYRHVVVLGETTQGIADKYNISPELLKAANPGLGNSVVKGDRLRVPDKTKINKKAVAKDPPNVPTPLQEEVKTEQRNAPIEPPKVQESQLIRHVVKKKETLYSIGREYGVTVQDILEVNPGLTTTIKIGQVIQVPKKKNN